MPTKENPVQHGRRSKRLRRRPKTYGDTRVCEADDCDTVLSIYNRRDRCHVHRRTRYPRIRGLRKRH